MSSYGSRSRTFVEVSLSWKQTSEGGEHPGAKIWTLRVNGWELSLRPRRRPGAWSCSDGMLGTPLFLAEAWLDDDQFTEVRVGGDFSEEWWERTDV